MPGSTSSGIHLGEHPVSLPSGIPKRVAVTPFQGSSSLSIASSDQFSNGLIQLGFEVVERPHMATLIKELQFQHSGIVADADLPALGRQLGVQGIFVGSVDGRRSDFFFNTFLNLRLVETETGRVIWSGRFSDPRIFGLTDDLTTSIIYTTKEALEHLEQDLRKARP